MTDSRAERLLWSTRLLIVAAVLGAVAMGAAALWLATVDVVVLAGDIAAYTTDPDRSSTRAGLVADVVKIVDTYLLAAILLLVAFGLHELFVSRLDHAEEAPGGPRLLVVRSVDDLKDRVAKLVVLILVIELFQRALAVGVADAWDLVAFAGAIALAAAALALSNLRAK